MKVGEEFLSLQERVKVVNSMPELHYGDLSTDKYVNKRLEKYGTLLKPYLVNGKNKILEIGCYTADLLSFLPSQVEYWGIDFDDKALEIAKQRGAKIVKCHLDVDELPITDRFDIVVCTEVLEHLLNPIKMVDNIKKLMKDNGVTIISLPNENTLYHRVMSFFGKGVDMCAFELYKHLHLPTVRQSEEFVAKHFKIIKKDYYINPSAKGSRSEWLGNILTKIPDPFWEKMARLFPGLFARGVIFLCCKL
ncbi:MAG: putative S-adenosylmethionine-dependent methyltransferase [candidate division WS2 bacterium]|nr:putative S-adenosylmethionine-dependent methyltransferase [Candidatus Lithacetigena glycinireducens]